jgi:peptidoglycan/xylan/chitin deacetylase (PgdA/CDA1 family)
LFAWKIWLRWLLAGALRYSGTLLLYRRRERIGPVILNYHRVLDPAAAENEAVPPGMYVRPQTFEKQLRYLARHYRVVTMEELLSRRERAEPVRRPFCVITFDDGWKDNYEKALPLLRKYGLPATLFLSTSFIGTGQTPWFYRLGHILRLLAEMSDDARAALRSSDRLDLPLPLASWLAAAAFERQRDIDAVVEELKKLPGTELETLVERLQQWMVSEGRPVHVDGAAMLDWQQVREMASSSVEIGSHGVTHMILTQIPPEAAEGELRESKRRIEEQVERPVGGFSYPNGNYSDAVEALVRAAGYRYACTTQPGQVEPRDNPFQLKRISVHDDITFSTALFACHIAGIFKLSH